MTLDYDWVVTRDYDWVVTRDYDWVVKMEYDWVVKMEYDWVVFFVPGQPLDRLHRRLLDLRVVWGYGLGVRV